MSKDIRSFFTRKDATSSGNKQNDSPPKKMVRKRARRVIESDSEDDDVTPVLWDESCRKKKLAESTEKKTSPAEKKIEAPEKQKESPVSISKYFGTSPVQQKAQHIKKVDKKYEEEKNSDSKVKMKKKKKEKSKLQSEEAYMIDDNDGFDECWLAMNDNELQCLTEGGKKDGADARIERHREKNDTRTGNANIKKIPSKEAQNENGKKTPVKNEVVREKEVKKTPVKAENAKRVTTPGSVDSKKGDSKSLMDSGRKKGSSEAYHRFLNRGGPKNPGSKPIPKGSPTCLEGLTFVISGVLDSMEREEAIELIQRCGGRTTSSISRKTSYIVLGEDAGESKIEKANQFGTKKLTEDDLLDLIRSKSNETKVEAVESSSSAEDFIAGTPKKDTSSKYFKSETPGRKRSLDESRASPVDKHKKARKEVEAVAPKYKIPEDKKSKNEAASSSSGYSSMTKSSMGIESMNDILSGVQRDSSLWVDKYKPQTTKQIIGQSGEKSNVKKLMNWLQNWSKNHLHSKEKKPRPAPWQSNDGSAFKAALLSGPPGVGKTTTVHLVCKELGFDIIEYNASVTRSKKLLQENVMEQLESRSMKKFLQDGKACSMDQVLVMDEVDGMAGNEDRGGVQELINLIKKTKVPIICMCNDRNHPKMRSLVNYCFDLRYFKPRIEQIKGPMMSICFKENVKISAEALEAILTNANHDIRQVLHNLSLWISRDKTLDRELAKESAEQAKKPLNLGPWDVARKVFSASEHANMSLENKEELFFQDYSLGPLFVQDTYVRVKPHKAKGDKKETLRLLSEAADSILIGDVMENSLRSQNEWDLLPVQAIFSSVLPGYYMEGHVQGQIQFPVWLGKNSKRNRFDRLLQELQMHMRLSISGSKEAVNMDYLHVLRDSLIRPLVERGSDGVPDTLKFMSDYNLTREDMDSVMELSMWPGRSDAFAHLDSKVKAALTRSYNKEGKVVPYATSLSVKKTKATDVEYELDGDEEVDEFEEKRDDDVELDAMIKKGKAKAKTERGENSGGGEKGRKKKKDDDEAQGSKSKGKEKSSKEPKEKRKK